MDLQVSEKILKQTVHCQHNFQCLNTDPSDVCPVDNNIKGDLLFVKPRKQDHCPYMMIFGYSYHICNCPTRKELFKRYNK